MFSHQNARILGVVVRDRFCQMIMIVIVAHALSCRKVSGNGEGRLRNQLSEQFTQGAVACDFRYPDMEIAGEPDRTAALACTGAIMFAPRDIAQAFGRGDGTFARGLRDDSIFEEAACLEDLPYLVGPRCGDHGSSVRSYLDDLVKRKAEENFPDDRPADAKYLAEFLFRQPRVGKQALFEYRAEDLVVNPGFSRLLWKGQGGLDCSFSNSNCIQF